MAWFRSGIIGTGWRGDCLVYKILIGFSLGWLGSFLRVMPMSIYATATSPLMTGIDVGTGASKYTDIVTQCVSTLASESKASVTDQLNAYQTLQSLMYSDISNNGKGGVLSQTNLNDAKRAADALNNAPIAQQMATLSGQLGGSLSPANPNPAKDMLNALSRFSQNDQQIIFVSGGNNVFDIHGKNNYFASLDDWKADLKKQAAAFVAQPPASDNVSSATTTATATGAKGSVNTVKMESKSTVTPLPKSGASATDASIALQTMLKFQAEMSAEKLAAAALAKKTSSVPNDTGLNTTAMVQTVSMLRSISSDANPAASADHLDRCA
jgi:hypothetical protein